MVTGCHKPKVIIHLTIAPKIQKGERIFKIWSCLPKRHARLISFLWVSCLRMCPLSLPPWWHVPPWDLVLILCSFLADSLSLQASTYVFQPSSVDNNKWHHHLHVCFSFYPSPCSEQIYQRLSQLSRSLQEGVWGQGVTGIWWPEHRHIAGHPTMQGRPWITKDYLAQMSTVSRLRNAVSTLHNEVYWVPPGAERCYFNLFFSYLPLSSFPLKKEFKI